MHKDRVVIVVVTVIVFSAILFGSFMAYRTYKAPMQVYNIDDIIVTLTDTSENGNRHSLERLAIFNELSRSCKMKDVKTGETRKFSKEEMDEIYDKIGGKEAVLNYLRNIENEEERKDMIRYAYGELKVITEEEFLELNEID